MVGRALLLKPTLLSLISYYWGFTRALFCYKLQQVG